jgi:hypothetical protein
MNEHNVQGAQNGPLEDNVKYATNEKGCSKTTTNIPDFLDNGRLY